MKHSKQRNARGGFPVLALLLGVGFAAAAACSSPAGPSGTPTAPHPAPNSVAGPWVIHAVNGGNVLQIGPYVARSIKGNAPPSVGGQAPSGAPDGLPIPTEGMPPPQDMPADNPAPQGTMPLGASVKPQDDPGDPVKASLDGLSGSTLIGAAALDCGIGEEVVRRLVIDGLLPWGPGGRFLFGPTIDVPGCDIDSLEQQDMLCIASRLKDVADAAAPIVWPHGAVKWNAPPGPLVIPPQPSSSKFIVRELAIYTLANIGVFDQFLHSVTYHHSTVNPLPMPAGGTPFDLVTQTVVATCTDHYALAAAGWTPVDDTNTSQLFDDSFPSGSNVLPPLGNGGGGPASIPLSGAARLTYKNAVLRSAARMLNDLVRDSVRDGVALAASQRAHAEDEQRGAELAWGLRTDGVTPYNSLAYAVRSLLGRWEFGVASNDPAVNPLMIGVTDQKCGGVAATDLVPSAYGPDLPARYNSRPPSTDGEELAVGLLVDAGVVIPTNQIVTSASAVKTNALEAIFTVRAYRNKYKLNGSTAAGGMTTLLQGDVDAFKASQGQTLTELWNKLSDGEVRYAVEQVARVYALTANVAPPADPIALPLPAIIPKCDPVVAGNPAFTSVHAICVSGGLSLSNLAAPAIAHAGTMQADSQCQEPVGLFGALTDYAYSYTFQDSFALGQTFMNRMVKLREVSRFVTPYAGTQVAAELAKATQESTFGAAETRAWAGPGKMLAYPFAHAGNSDGNNFSGIAVSFLGLALGDLGAKDLPTLIKNVRLVKGEPWQAECVAGLRKCPPGVQKGIAASTGASSYSTLTPSTAKTRYQYGFEGPIPTLVFHTQAPATFSIVLLSSPDGHGKGAVLGSLTIRSPISTNNGQPFYPTTSVPIAPLQAKLLDQAIGVNSEAFAYQKSKTSCVIRPGTDGLSVSEDLFVPLENELTGGAGGDTFESSWQHYLAEAKTAALLADDLGEKMVQAGLQKDLRREEAQAKVGAICGKYSALGDTSVSATGAVTSADASTKTCIAEEKFDIAFLGQDPVPPDMRPKKTSYTNQAEKDQDLAAATKYIKDKVLLCSTSKVNRLCQQQTIDYTALQLAGKPQPNPPNGPLPPSCSAAASLTPSLFSGDGFSATTAATELGSQYMNKEALQVALGGVKFTLSAAAPNPWRLSAGLQLLSSDISGTPRRLRSCGRAAIWFRPRPVAIRSPRRAATRGKFNVSRRPFATRERPGPLRLPKRLPLGGAWKARSGP